MVADQWRADPSLLFITREQCAEQVRNGNRVYPDVSMINKMPFRPTFKNLKALQYKMVFSFIGVVYACFYHE